MAAPTVDSLNPPTGMPPAEGPGSKTPLNSPVAPGAPIGSSTIKPLGAPGAPQKVKPMVLDKLDEDSFSTLVDDIYSAMGDAKVEAKSVNEILDYLLNNSWSEKRLLTLSKYLKSSIRDMIRSIQMHIKKEGVNETIDLIKKKIMEIRGGEEILSGSESSTTSLPGGSPLGLPPIGASNQDNFRKITGVDLDIVDIRGLTSMGKILVKDGSVVDSSQYAQEIINRISTAIRNVKKSMKEYEDLQLKYAGAFSLKTAIADLSSGLGGGPAGNPSDMGGPDAAGPVGPEEASGSASGDVGEKLDDLLEKVEDISSTVEEISNKVSEGEGKLEEDVDILKKETSEGEKEMDKLGEPEVSSVEAKIEEARQVIAFAKGKLDKKDSYNSILKKVRDVKKKAAEEKKENPFKNKEDKKEEEKEEEKEEKKEDKESKKEEKKEEKKEASTVDLESLIRKVRARLEELRSEKEANLYPFKKEIKPIPPVDNINAETAKQQYSKTLDKATYEADKDYENINFGDIGQKELPYSIGKGAPAASEGKKVSVEVAERIRKHSVQNAVDQARLSIELAARQQLKGLIDDPLREVLRRNMVEAGLSEEVSDAIIHNAYIDGFEASHKAIMKEAFENFMTKDIDEFTKIAKFVDEYQVKNAVGSVENTDETFRDKEASIEDAPLRGFAADKDFRREAYKRYWQEQSKKRGYV